MPVGDSQVADIALIQALRAMQDLMRVQTDILQGVAGRQDKFETGMEAMLNGVANIDKRMSIFEGTALEDIKRNRERLDKHAQRHDDMERYVRDRFEETHSLIMSRTTELETRCISKEDLAELKTGIKLLERDHSERAGAKKFADIVRENIGGLLMLMAFVAYLVSQGKIV